MAAGFKLRYPKAGKHAEFDWSRQVLVLARGASRTDPPRILRQAFDADGVREVPLLLEEPRATTRTGMYYSNYFIGGYAIHGYSPVPAYAASHGCIRIPIPSAVAVYRWVSLGDTDLRLPLSPAGRRATSPIAIVTSRTAAAACPFRRRGIAARRVGTTNPPKSRGPSSSAPPSPTPPNTSAV